MHPVQRAVLYDKLSSMLGERLRVGILAGQRLV